MRLLQVTIPAGKRETIERAFEDEGVDYVMTDETSGREYTAVAYVPLPTEAVEPVLERLREAGLDDQAYTVIVEANTVISRHFEQLEERYAEEQDEERIAREELTSKASDFLPSWSNYVIFTLVSAVIATAGLLLDSPAVIVGSMVIAPLIGPAMAASVGTVLDEEDLFRRGFVLQVSGLLLSIVSAGLFAWLARTGLLIPPGLEITEVPSIRERLLPDFLSLAVAIGSGVAGVVSLISGVSTALVGVMIAVALMPPAATVGIGIAWGQPWVSLGAGVLLLVNVLSINLAAIVVLWYRGYRPDNWFEVSKARKMARRRAGLLVFSILLLSVFLAGVTFDSYQRTTTEDDIRETVGDTIADRPGVTFESMTIERTDGVLFRQPERVVVTVGVPPDSDHSGLARTLDRRLDEVAGTDVETQVRYVDTESA
ncbi:TIGR00341 family protein [Halapricum sp. CBA1109]|uniref:TIGR00341 family protein n=1 Tax=Halapricum sp. CBA1109 TaxID=2668068 RepID=UPI0013BE86C1|nr:TIGR00341 family protein [Halapricum sp. CBA1109]